MGKTPSSGIPAERNVQKNHPQTKSSSLTRFCEVTFFINITSCVMKDKGKTVIDSCMYKLSLPYPGGPELLLAIFLTSTNSFLSVARAAKRTELLPYRSMFFS